MNALNSYSDKLKEIGWNGEHKHLKNDAETGAPAPNKKHEVGFQKQIHGFLVVYYRGVHKRRTARIVSHVK
jgi:hypothetical protein